MAYSTKPIYYFDNKDSTGINNIPLGRLLIVSDYEYGVSTFIKNNNTNLDDFSTIDDAINNSNIIQQGYSKSEVDELIRPSLVVSSNDIDFTKGKNFIIDATEANLTVANAENLVGQSGQILIQNAENLVALGSYFISTYEPDDVFGTELLEYFIESPTKVHIGRKFTPNFGI